MRVTKWLMIGAVGALLGAASLAGAGEVQHKASSAAAPAKSPAQEALDECKVHPAVTHGGTPLEVCMDAYGFVKKNGKWVKKPAHR